MNKYLNEFLRELDIASTIVICCGICYVIATTIICIML